MPLTVDEMGVALANQFHLKPTSKGYRQIRENCVEIAERTMAVLGYRLPRYNGSKGMLSLLRRWGAHENTCFGPAFPEIATQGYLVCREDDSGGVPCFCGFDEPVICTLHVSIEHEGVEYNFGATDDDGFPVKMKIPLERAI